jgi:hypothetical protein
MPAWPAPIAQLAGFSDGQHATGIYPSESVNGPSSPVGVQGLNVEG